MISLRSAKLILSSAGFWPDPVEPTEAAVRQQLEQLAGRADEGDVKSRRFLASFPQLSAFVARANVRQAGVWIAPPASSDTQPATVESQLSLDAALPAAAIALLRRLRFDRQRLIANEHQTNNSVLRFDGVNLMAYRVGWESSRIALCELDVNFRPVRNWLLPLQIGDNQEDPRLFVFRGRLHVSYSSIRRKNGVQMIDVCYARLEKRGGDWIVDGEWYPHFNDRSTQEKNWGFFEHAGELFAVYSISPHLVLKIDGERAELAHETTTDFGKAGLLRGGAPPMLWQGEFYSFYHRCIGKLPRTYTIDLYTFEAKPPFRPSRQIATPLLVPNINERPNDHVNVAFSGGAYRDAKNSWVVSFGYQDKFIELATWDVNLIETALQPLPGGPFEGLSLREDDGSRHVWKQVYLGNEYRLPERMDGQVVIDVGAHVGSFSRACLDRGAALVVSCEPDSKSLPCLRANLAAAGERSRIVPAYVTADAVSDLPKQYTGRMTPDATASRTSLASVLASVPRVDWLKIDCEGPEHEMVRQVDLSGVRHVVGEVHRRPGMGIESFTADLERQGFSVEWKALGGWDWLWNFWAERKP